MTAWRRWKIKLRKAPLPALPALSNGISAAAPPGMLSQQRQTPSSAEGCPDEPWVWEPEVSWAPGRRRRSLGCTRSCFSLRKPFKPLPFLFTSLQTMDTPCLLGLGALS